MRTIVSSIIIVLLAELQVEETFMSSYYRMVIVLDMGLLSVLQSHAQKNTNIINLQILQSSDK